MRRTTLDARKPRLFAADTPHPSLLRDRLPPSSPVRAGCSISFSLSRSPLPHVGHCPAFKAPSKRAFVSSAQDSKARHRRARRKAHGSAEQFLTFIKPTPHGRTKRTQGPTWPPPAADRPA